MTVILHAAEVVILAFIWVTGAGVAFVQIRQTRKLAQQKSFLAFLRDYNSELRVDDAFVVLRAEDKKWSDLSDREKADVKYLLNKFEMLAIGLEKGIYDEEMVEATFGVDLYINYHLAERFIRAIRAQHAARYQWMPRDYQEAYSEFEKLADKIKIKSRNG